LERESDGVGGTGDLLEMGEDRGISRTPVKMKGGLETISSAGLLGLDRSREGVSGTGCQAEPPPISFAVIAVGHPPVGFLGWGNLKSLGVDGCFIFAGLVDPQNETDDTSNKNYAAGDGDTDEGVPRLLFLRKAANENTLHDTSSKDTIDIPVKLGKARLNEEQNLKSEDPAPGSDSHYVHKDLT
jgi:hypothetical protein